jgi:hypothetical protein
MVRVSLLECQERTCDMVVLVIVENKQHFQFRLRCGDDDGRSVDLARRWQDSS